MAPLILSIEGNIGGVGKSTLLKNLRANRELASNGVIFVDEPVAIWEQRAPKLRKKLFMRRYNGYM